MESMLARRKNRRKKGGRRERESERDDVGRGVTYVRSATARQARLVSEFQRKGGGSVREENEKRKGGKAEGGGGKEERTTHCENARQTWLRDYKARNI